MALNAASVTGVVVWVYRNDYNLWSAYEPHVSQEIEKAHSSRTQPKLNLGTITPALSCYEIDLLNLEQLQINTGKCRQIKRQVHPPNSALANNTIWEYEGDHPGQWFMYDSETLELINDAFLKFNQGASPVFDLIRLPYRIDLNNLIQIRINTGTKRNIRRRVLNQSYSADTTGGMPSFLSSASPVPTFSGYSSGEYLFSQHSDQAVASNGKVKHKKSTSGSKHHPYNSNGHLSKGQLCSTKKKEILIVTITGIWSVYQSLGTMTIGKIQHSMQSQSQTTGQMGMVSNMNVFHPFPLAMPSVYYTPLTLPQSQAPSTSLSQFSVPHLEYHPLLQSLPQPLTETLPSTHKITIKNKACKCKKRFGTTVTAWLSLFLLIFTLIKIVKKLKIFYNFKLMFSEAMSGQEVLGRYMTKVHTDLDKTDCAICCDKLSEASSYGDGHPEAYEAIQLSRCSHQFHKLCLLTMYNSSHKDDSLQCPSCKMIYGEKTGICPPGNMSWKIMSGNSLAGYEGYNTICVTYHLSSGIQGPEHPQPGQPYTCRGFPRQGFLPDCDKGRKVLKLLMEAFRRRLMFTIGISHTTGEPNTVTWNEIHHKTELHGNQSGHGYPDPNYLDNVLQELAAYGITEDCLATT
ncbi:unnamed protein product [Lymnaea stagnalis]|uniref:E3 ubiquitin-protein ligase n=1 Tax=Lymnaea stagnalis TaxID=6523 RepID=A0AAV2HY81_LYMST